jgi:predicted RNA-binding protein (virulence factor B family)
MQIGEYNELEALRQTDNGWYLIDEEKNEVLMPNKYIPENFSEGATIRVFVYKDSEDRLVATTDTPLITLNEFAYLQVKQVNNIGAFLEWGMEKDLMVPFREQPNKMQEGKSYVVRMVHDIATDRLFATARINKYLISEHITVSEKDEVDAIILDETDIGYKAIIENAHLGLLYKSETFRHLEPGDRIKVWVKKIREDGKIDLSIEPLGYEKIEPNAQKILNVLEENNGFLPLHDNSNPLEISGFLEMSKKTFKKAIGNLYKQKLILLEDNGIKQIKK